MIENTYRIRPRISLPLIEILDYLYPADPLCDFIHAYLPQEVSSNRRIARKTAIGKLLLLAKDPDASWKLFQRLPLPAQRIYTALAWTPVLSATELNAIAAEPVFRLEYVQALPYQYSGGWQLIADDCAYSFLIYSPEYRPNVRGEDAKNVFALYYLFLPPAVRQWFRSFLPEPPAHELKALGTAPEGTGLRFFSAATDVQFAMPLLMQAIAQNKVTFTKSGMPTVPACRKLVKSGAVREFFDAPDDPDSLRILRHQKLFAALKHLPAAEKKQLAEGQVSLETLLADVIGDSVGRVDVVYNNAIDYVHFETSSQVFKMMPAQSCIQAFADLPEGEWVSINAFIDYIQSRNPLLLPHNGDYAGGKLYYDSRLGVRINESFDHSFTEVERYKYFFLPVMRGACFFLAALGLLDIAYTLPPASPFWFANKKDNFLSPFEGLQAIRLNQAGAFAFGKRDKLELKDALPNKPVLHFSETHRIARVENMNPLIAQVLGEYTERLAVDVFQLTRSRLMGKTKTLKELKERIQTFRTSLGVDLPPQWESFIDEVSDAKSPLVRSGGKHSIFKVSADPSLRHLFLADPILKSNCLRVEGGRVAIAETKIPIVQNRLRELGHLFEI